MSTSPATVAFVTGASRGIGRVIATALAEGDHAVAGFARDSSDLASLPSAGVVPFALDVTDPAAVESTFAAAAAQVGPPTLLVTCAGTIDALGPVAEADPERWWRAVEIDLRGTMLCARAALAWMLPAHTGRVVTIYGNLGDDGSEHLSAFAVAKAGIARLTETLATELVGSGVVALCVHPGFVRTPMTDYLAHSDDGRRWLPGFGERAHRHWGDGRSAAVLVRRIANGDADDLTGRIVFASDDLTQSRLAGDRRRLRIRNDR
jgi:NAD(P)-dependent dehydrogenase (short-subunit alcohol dehydrogenase family)